MKELPCAELFEDDGRRTNGKYHKGKWGRHLTNSQLDDIMELPAPSHRKWVRAEVDNLVRQGGERKQS